MADSTKSASATAMSMYYFPSILWNNHGSWWLLVGFRGVTSVL